MERSMVENKSKHRIEVFYKEEDPRGYAVAEI
jgi:hypothetical protein